MENPYPRMLVSISTTFDPASVSGPPLSFDGARRPQRGFRWVFAILNPQDESQMWILTTTSNASQVACLVRHTLERSVPWDIQYYNRRTKIPVILLAEEQCHCPFELAWKWKKKMAEEGNEVVNFWFRSRRGIGRHRKKVEHDLEELRAKMKLMDAFLSESAQWAENFIAAQSQDGVNPVSGTGNSPSEPSDNPPRTTDDEPPRQPPTQGLGGAQ